jgi:hypothetical protein
LAAVSNARAIANAGSLPTAWQPGLHGLPSAGRRLSRKCTNPASRTVWALIATSVRFFAFHFFMILRTWTFTMLSHMFNS